MFSEYLKQDRIKGFGTYMIKDRYILDEAVENGHNFFDCGELYKNEQLVVDVIKNNPDKQLFVSTKISYIAIEKGQIEKSFYERLKIFDGIKINILLLHKPSSDCRRDWELLSKLYSNHRDKIDYIGVSNYDLKHLDQIKGLPLPFFNQIELTPFYNRIELVHFCRKNNIIIVSHTSLVRCIKNDNQILVELANKYQTKVVAILLKWARQNGYLTIPRTNQKSHLLENIQENSFVITKEDMAILNDLNEEFFLTKVMF
jgi:diketogulonate reductase-like aldo/keto reductase